MKHLCIFNKPPASRVPHYQRKPKVVNYIFLVFEGPTENRYGYLISSLNNNNNNDNDNDNDNDDDNNNNDNTTNNYGNGNGNGTGNDNDNDNENDNGNDFDNDNDARGFWVHQRSAFYLVRVCYPSAESYRDLEPKQIYRMHEKEASVFKQSSRRWTRKIHALRIHYNQN